MDVVGRVMNIYIYIYIYMCVCVRAYISRVTDCSKSCVLKTWISLDVTEI